MSDFDKDDFENGQFNEDELLIIKRMLPSRFMPKARQLSRRDFFRDVLSSSDGKKSAGPLRSAVYRMALSKRVVPDPLALSKRRLPDT